MSAVRKDPAPPVRCCLCQEEHEPDKCPHLLAVKGPADELVRVARQADVPAHVLPRIVDRRYAAAQPRLLAVAVVVLHPVSEHVLVLDGDCGPTLPGGPIGAGQAPRDAAERHLQAQSGLRPRRFDILCRERFVATEAALTAAYWATLWAGEPQAHQAPLRWCSWRELMARGAHAWFYGQVARALGARS